MQRAPVLGEPSLARGLPYPALYLGHGTQLYWEQVHVPLVIRLPRARLAGRVIGAPVALVDVAPTPASFQGVSLRDTIEGTEAPAE